MIINHSSNNQKVWNSVPFIPDINSKLLQMDIFKEYSEDRFKQIKTLSTIHKLTYKIDEYKKQIPNTFYHKLICE